MTTAVFLLLGVLFLPAVAWMSKLPLKRKRATKHRPGLMLFTGLFFALAGLFSCYLVVMAALSGSVPCPLKGCLADYEVGTQPVAYWISVVGWYAFAVWAIRLGVAIARASTQAPE